MKINEKLMSVVLVAAILLISLSDGSTGSAAAQKSSCFVNGEDRCISNQQALNIAAQKDPDSYVCDVGDYAFDKDFNPIYDSNGEPMRNCRYIGGEESSKDNSLTIILAVVIPLLALIALCATCYCKEKRKCCFPCFEK